MLRMMKRKVVMKRRMRGMSRSDSYLFESCSTSELLGRG